jgi:ethanolamine phosphate phosphodiesterase
MREKDTPLILLSHIPLYRPPDSDCGPLREKGTIPAARGEGYQTLLSPETTYLLLNELRPTLIFRYFPLIFSIVTSFLQRTDSID